ncbi:uncharacterized protein LOC144320103 [Canis aureus]
MAEETVVSSFKRNHGVFIFEPEDQAQGNKLLYYNWTLGNSQRESVKHHNLWTTTGSAPADVNYSPKTARDLRRGQLRSGQKKEKQMKTGKTVEWDSVVCGYRSII